MPYHLIQAANPAFIEESQYGIAAQVTFSPINSCILIAASVGNGNVVGIHLVMIQSDTWFTPADVNVVTGTLAALSAVPGTTIVFGQTFLWAATQPVQAGYGALIAALAP
ncbi:MAG: hypothetical protein ABIW83_07075, partial [Allosphingosinicella sp.]